MKKTIFCLCLLLVALIQISDAAEKNPSKHWNDRTHLVAAERLSAIEGVRDAAVLSCDGMMLVGVRMENPELAGFTWEQSNEIIKEMFPKIRTCRMFVGDDKADSVVELSFYADTDIDRRILRKRFKYLMGKAQENLTS